MTARVRCYLCLGTYCTCFGFLRHYLQLVLFAATRSRDSVVLGCARLCSCACCVQATDQEAGDSFCDDFHYLEGHLKISSTRPSFIRGSVLSPKEILKRCCCAMTVERSSSSWRCTAPRRTWRAFATTMHLLSRRKRNLPLSVRCGSAR